MENLLNYEFDDELSFYTEKETALIYEAKFFETFVLVRPASPAFYSALRKMDHVAFSKEFEEFYGDKQQVRAFLTSWEENDAILLQ